jgi:hypothetical protein
MESRLVQDRSYSSSCFRPRPRLFFDHALKRLIVITKWSGDLSEAIVARHLENFLDLAFDPEKTRVASTIQENVSLESHFVSALSSLNEWLTSEVNALYLKNLFEVCILQLEPSKLSWASVGQPHIMLSQLNDTHILRDEKTDSESLSSGGPLPLRALGIFPEVKVSSGVVVLESAPTVYLLSRDNPARLHSPSIHSAFEDLERSLIEEDPEAPFWLGLVNLI